MPLVINSLGGGRTHARTHAHAHTHTHTETVLRNQARRPVTCAWFKNHGLYSQIKCMHVNLQASA